MIRLRFIALILALAVTSAVSASQTSDSVQIPQTPTLAPMLQKVSPAVVSISTTGTIAQEDNPLMQDPLFRRFFGDPELAEPPPLQNLGSGVIVDAENGYILTNAHLIEAADEITVTLPGGQELPAKLVGSDPPTDVAVLQVDTDAVELTEIPLGDSDKLQVGDFVVALGNPFGLGQTATSGIVSALERSGLTLEGYESFIQTDASINPGNSGGALINLQGELIGINTAILAPAGGNIGIGFAIPINMARTVAEQLVAHGEIRRGQLGVMVQDLTPALAKAFGINASKGAIVSQVVPDSPAARAGLQSGDVIVGIDGEAADSAAAVRNRVGLMPVGETVTLNVIRGDQELAVDVVVEPQATAEAGSAEGGDTALEGAELATAEVTLDGQPQQRVRIVQLEPDSPAARAGLRPGDVIISVNREPVQTVAELQQAIDEADSQAVLLVRRGEGAFFVALPVG